MKKKNTQQDKIKEPSKSQMAYSKKCAQTLVARLVEWLPSGYLFSHCHENKPKAMVFHLCFVDLEDFADVTWGSEQ